MIRVRQLALFAMLVLMVLATISLFRDAAESESPSSRQQASEQAVDGGAEPTLAPPILAATDAPAPSAPVAVDRAAVTTADAGARRVFVREIFEEGRLADFRLWEVDGATTEDLPLVATDASGEALLGAPDLERLRLLRDKPLRARRTWQGSVWKVDARLKSIELPDSKGKIELQVATLACIELSIRLVNVELENHVVRLTGLPSIPADAFIEPAEQEILEKRKDADASSYLNHLERRFGPFDRLELELKGTAVEPAGSKILVPWSGEVKIELEDAVGRRSARIRIVRPGATSSVECVLRDLVGIGGRVLRLDGSPVPGARVIVYTKTGKERGDPTLHEWVNAGGEETSHVSTTTISPDDPSPKAIVTIEQKAHTISDDEGRYRVAMPYSDEVGAWVMEPAIGAGEAIRDVATQKDFVRDLDILLEPRPPGPRGPKLLDPAGRPLARVTFRVFSLDPRFPFDRLYPKLTTDDAGLLDVWFIPDGTECSFVDTESAFHSERFRIGSAPTLSFTRRR